MAITNDIRYIGVNDRVTDLFESQYIINNGVTYNSYVILDEKIAVFDTVGTEFAAEWDKNLENVLEGRKPDYLIVQHMEPDHSANIADFAKKYPETTIVSSPLAFTMMNQFFGTDYADRRIVVNDGDTLELGTHTLTFIAAPMVHWPEVTMTYDSKDKVLFSADGFGRFGAPCMDRADVDESCRADMPEFEAEPWEDEARRYYIGIVGKYGPQVQAVLAKAKNLEIEKICPLHGPVLTKDLGKYMDIYDKWSSYTPEEKGVAICYSSVYGHTKEAVLLLAEKMKENAGDTKIEIFDLARCDVSEAVACAFKYDRLVLATTTYNMDIFPCMKDFIHHLGTSNFQKRKVALIGNGSWAPKAADVMKDLLSSFPDISFADPVVYIRSAMNDANRDEIAALAKVLG